MRNCQANKSDWTDKSGDSPCKNTRGEDYYECGSLNLKTHTFRIIFS